MRLGFNLAAERSTARGVTDPRGVFRGGWRGWVVSRSVSVVEGAAWRRHMLDDASEALDSMRHPLMKANITDTSREDAFTDKVIKVRS